MIEAQLAVQNGSRWRDVLTTMAAEVGDGAANVNPRATRMHNAGAALV